MNKTVNINLGGMFFHIDEDAYQKLTRYFEAIKRSLSNSSGQDEIIKDIEMRIGELIAEKHTSDKQVINLREIDEVIAVMGQPEDYRLDNDDEPARETPPFYSPKASKKLYRDKEKGMIGGVAAGLGHYFGIDAVWIRILLVLFVWIGGSGIIAYIVLWIVMPEAITTSEKLEMMGEPVNISNIERKVREEFDSVSERIKNVDYDQMGNQVKSGANRFAENIGDVFLTVFKVFAKVLGAILVVFAAVMLVSLLVGLLTLGSSSFVDVPWQDYVDSVNYTQLPLWTISLLVFLSVGIPFFFLFILGLKLLVNNLKSIGSIAKYTLLALWLIAISVLIALGLKQATEFAYDGKSVQKEIINIQPNDTLKIKFKYNDYFAKDILRQDEYSFTQDENNNQLIYSNEINFHIVKTDEKMPYLQIERQAQGKSSLDARKRADAIKYAYVIEGNNIVLDNYLLTQKANKYRDQKVEIYLYVPDGLYIKPDASLQDYDNSDNYYFNLHFDGDYIYKVGPTQIKCIDCPASANEYDDNSFEINEISNDSTVSTKLSIDQNGVEITTTENAPAGESTNVTITKKGLYIKDGVVSKKQ